jgi:hypothetical protein
LFRAATPHTLPALEDAAMTPRIVDAETIAAYDRDGAAVVRGAFAPHWVALLAAGVERNVREPGPYGKRYTPEGRPGLFFGDYCSWRRIPNTRPSCATPRPLPSPAR